MKNMGGTRLTNIVQRRVIFSSGKNSDGIIYYQKTVKKGFR